MLETNTSFSIENEINPNTQEPFGSKYAGLFKVRRPSIQDRNIADIKKAAMMSQYGSAELAQMGDWTKTSIYIYSLTTTIATDKLPEWFDLTAMYDANDEEALMAVWAKVGKFLDSFRPKPAGGDSGAGSK